MAFLCHRIRLRINVSWVMEFLIFGFKIIVFPHVAAAATILFLKLECGNYSREETNNFSLNHANIAEVKKNTSKDQ